MARSRLAMIPARSGSKGVPGKNLRDLGGRTLLARAVATACEAEIFDRVYVSTDSEEYADAARSAGADVPFLRPAELATDTSLVADAIRHTLERFEERGERYDTLALLEPTSPLRTAKLVTEVTLAAEVDPWDAAFTVSRVPAHHHPLKQFRLTAEGEARFFSSEARPNVNRQELEATFVRNGVCYAVRVPVFLETNSIHGRRAKAFVVEGPAVSIDTEQDLETAREWVARGNA